MFRVFFLTSQSIKAESFPDFEMLDAKDSVCVEKKHL